MIKEVARYSDFSEIDFIKLYCAIAFKNGYSRIINHHELEKRLYEFSSLSEFSKLFQDICPKEDYLNPENSYLDLGASFQTATLFGLLTPITGTVEASSIISCSEDIVKDIIANIDPKMVDKMNELLNLMFGFGFTSKKEEKTLEGQTKKTQPVKLMKKIY